MTTAERTHLVFRSDDEFESFVEYERERRRRSPARPAGARLSIMCPIQMVQAIYDADCLPPIDPGDGDRGHEIESRVRATLLHGVMHHHQPRVDWSHGVSAFDMLVHEPVEWIQLEPGDFVEVKSTIGRLAMHPDYRATTQRRMVASGMQPGQLVKLFVVHPGNYRWVGPLVVDLDQDAYDTYSVQLRKIGEAIDLLNSRPHPESSPNFRSAIWWAQTFGLTCSCGGCTEHTAVEPNDALTRLVYRWELAMDTVDDAAAVLGGKPSFAWREQGLRADLVTALDRQTVRAKRDQRAIRIDVETASRGVRASWSPKTQRWTIKRNTSRSASDAA